MAVPVMKYKKLEWVGESLLDEIMAQRIIYQVYWIESQKVEDGKEDG